MEVLVSKPVHERPVSCWSLCCGGKWSSTPGVTSHALRGYLAGWSQRQSQVNRQRGGIASHSRRPEQEEGGLAVTFDSYGSKSNQISLSTVFCRIYSNANREDRKMVDHNWLKKMVPAEAGLAQQ